jgi:hypothetical protein
MIWDLKNNQEIKSSTLKQSFYDPRTYSDNGFEIAFRTLEYDSFGEKSTTIKTLDGNDFETAFIAPYTIHPEDGDHTIGCYFKPYSERGLIEINYLKNRL